MSRTPDPDALRFPPPRPVSAGLYIVATPIGNLRDITLRALDVLSVADIVLAEDTRVTGRLLSAFGLKASVWRCDDHVGASRAEEVIARIEAGAIVALVSDAGTPLISDPGYVLVRAVSAAGLPVHPIPGASSLTAALSAAGLPSDRVLFVGFLPPKSAARTRALEALGTTAATLVFFESGPRLRASLSDMARALGPREACVAREITKLHETFERGTLDDLARRDSLDAPRGEIVVMVAPPARGESEVPPEGEIDAALTDALQKNGPSQAAAEVATRLGLDRRALYRRALALKAGT